MDVGEIRLAIMSAPVKRASRPSLDAAQCPLCGEANRCALAADPNATDCWCDSVVFPAELLAKIPDNKVRKNCVCQKCLDKFTEERKQV